MPPKPAQKDDLLHRLKKTDHGKADTCHRSRRLHVSLVYARSLETRNHHIQKEANARTHTSGPRDRAADMDRAQASPAAAAWLSARAAAFVWSPDMSVENDYDITRTAIKHEQPPIQENANPTEKKNKQKTITGGRKEGGEGGRTERNRIRRGSRNIRDCRCWNTYIYIYISSTAAAVFLSK